MKIRHTFAKVRLECRSLCSPRTPVDNLYLATVQKSGSQWVKKVFSDPEMQEITRLKVYPQHNYEFNEFKSRFPVGTVIPGLYIDYPTFDVFVRKPKNYKVIYVIRDPRDIAVSWYHSMYSTHGERQGVDRVRRTLKGMTKEDGLSYAIKYLSPKFASLRSWVELSKGDSNVRFVKFEEMTDSPGSSFEELLTFCGFDFDREHIDSILSKYTKSNMRKTDLKNRSEDSESHYREKSSSFRDEFTTDHSHLFRQVTGNLVELLGYDL